MSWLSWLPDITLPEHIDIDIINLGDDVDGNQVQGDLVEGDQIESEYAVKSKGDIIPIDRFERVVPGRLSGDSPIDVSADKKELIIDPENLEGDDEWDEIVKPGLKSGWEEEQTVSFRDSYPILLQAERNLTDEKIEDIKGFFHGKILSSDYLLLQSSLTLDRAMNAEEAERLSNRELKDQKRRLAEKYHDAAFSLPSMCTSGYFDEGELFREVYRLMQEESEYDVDDYDRTFRKLISSKPFVAYAKDSQSEDELADIILGKIKRFPNYNIPLPYLDVRGIGSSNHRKIRNAMETVEEEYKQLDFDERVGDYELIVRIEATSISKTTS